MLSNQATSTSDPELVNRVLAAMREFVLDGMTILVVTHEIGFARQGTEDVVFMVDGRKVGQCSPAQIFDAPTRTRTRGRLDARLRHDMTEADVP